jgi:hypothetical protein
MRVSNDPEGQATGAFADLLRLQSNFQIRMTEETLRYLRALQVALSPVAPTTVVKPITGKELRAAGAPGQHVELELKLENAQRAYTTATAALTPLVELGGTTWYPVAEPSPPLLLIAPGETATLRVGVTLPTELPAGDYHGALLLQGFRQEGLSLVVKVSRDPAVAGAGGSSGPTGETAGSAKSAAVSGKKAAGSRKKSGGNEKKAIR